MAFNHLRGSVRWGAVASVCCLRVLSDSNEAVVGDLTPRPKEQEIRRLDVAVTDVGRLRAVDVMEVSIQEIDGASGVFDALQELAVRWDLAFDTGREGVVREFHGDDEVLGSTTALDVPVNVASHRSPGVSMWHPTVLVTSEEENP